MFRPIVGTTNLRSHNAKNNQELLRIADNWLSPVSLLPHSSFHGFEMANFCFALLSALQQAFTCRRFPICWCSLNWISSISFFFIFLIIWASNCSKLFLEKCSELFERRPPKLNFDLELWKLSDLMHSLLSVYFAQSELTAPQEKERLQSDSPLSFFDRIAFGSHRHHQRGRAKMLLCDSKVSLESKLCSKLVPSNQFETSGLTVKHSFSKER